MCRGATKTTDSSWLAFETVMSLFATGQASTLFLEVGHADGWESRSSVMLGFIVVSLVDWDSGVNYGWLNSLLLNNRLDRLVDMVVDVLPSDDRSSRVAFMCCSLGPCVLELSSFLFDTCLDLGRITMVMFTVLNGNHVVRMLLGQNLTVLDRLDGCVIVILMNFTVNGRGGFLMTVFGDVFIHDSGSNFLVDGGVMVTRFVPGKVNQPTRSRSGCTTRSSHGPQFDFVNKIINRFGCRRL